MTASKQNTFNEVGDLNISLQEESAKRGGLDHLDLAIEETLVAIKDKGEEQGSTVPPLMLGKIEKVGIDMDSNIFLSQMSHDLSAEDSGHEGACTQCHDYSRKKGDGQKVVMHRSHYAHKNSACLARPTGSRKLKWDLIVMASAIFNCFSIPFKVAFEPEEMNKNYFSIINSFIDLVFLIDMIVNFRTTFMDEKGEEISDPRRIALNYLQLHFWIDLVATLPLAEIISALI